MKTWFAALLLLAAMCMLPAALAENAVVEQLEDGHYNIFLSNGYFGYDVQYGMPEGDAGHKFTVAKTDDLVTTDDLRGGSSIHSADGVRLAKHMFVNYYDIIFEDYIRAQFAVWWCTSSITNWKTSELADKLLNDIRNNAVQDVPDHGAQLQLDEHTTAYFDFIGLLAHDADGAPADPREGYNNLLGYKVRYEVTGDVGGSAALTVPPLFANDTTTRQWQVKNNGTYENISGETGSSLTLSPLSAAQNGQEYRCIVDKTTGAYFDYKLIIANAQKPDDPDKPDGPKQPDVSALPQTGDSSVLALWAVLFVLSAVSMTVMRRRHA